MKLLFVHDTYYTPRNNGGAVYAHGAFGYGLWALRFLPHFDHVTVIGRKKLGGDISGLPLSSGAGVSFELLDNINKPAARLLGAGQVRTLIARAVENADMVVIRGPSEFGLMAASCAKKAGKAYVVEVSGCGFENLWYYGSWVARFYAPFKYLRVRRMVRAADGALYVTRDFLQKRYPAKGYTEYASNVDLDFAPFKLKKNEPGQKKFKIGMVGNYANNLKGLDIAFKALAQLRAVAPDMSFTFHILGNGDRDKWLKIAENLGVGEYIKFEEALSDRQQVGRFLDGLDLYIQPSRHEGLPRAMIEAMSCALPVIGANVGGMPELLENGFMHRRGDHRLLARQILMFLQNADLRAKEGARNYERSKLYSPDILKQRRDGFYRQIKTKVCSSCAT